MSDEKWAVYLDCGIDAFGILTRNTVVLAGSIRSTRHRAQWWLDQMAVGGDVGEQWEVDEDDLPYGYTFQTYYVAPYYGADIEKGVTV